MDQQLVRKILNQIARGHSVFDTNSTEQAQMLGYEPGVEMTDAEAGLLQHHLEALNRQGLIRIVSISVAGSYAADLTIRGRDYLRQAGG